MLEYLAYTIDLLITFFFNFMRMEWQYKASYNITFYLFQNFLNESLKHLDKLYPQSGMVSSSMDKTKMDPDIKK